MLSITFPMVLAGEFAYVLYCGWRKWPDLLIDFGLNLYIPWQISCGKVLYRDLHQLYGPLSQYWDGFLFYLFGSSLTVLIVANIAASLFLVFIVYRYVGALSSQKTAFVVCGFLIAVFLGSQYVTGGNYNFITPYSEEAAHGLILSFVYLWLIALFFNSSSLKVLFFCGLVFGLTGLTKIDIFVATFAVTVAFWAVWRKLRRAPVPSMLRSVTCFTAGAVIPFLAFFAYFVTQMPLPNAIRGACGAWYYYFNNSHIAHNAFFIRGMGLDHPGRNIGTMVAETAEIMLVYFAVVALSHCLVKYKNKRPFAVLSGLGLFSVIALAFCIDTYKFGRSFPMLVLLGGGAFFFTAIGNRKNQAEAKQNGLMVLLAIFAFCMLWKMVLFSRFFLYGFYLGIPATVFLILLSLFFVPHWLERRMRGTTLSRYVLAIMLCIMAGKFLSVSNVYYKAKDFAVGSDGDKIVAFDPRFDLQSVVVADAIGWLKNHTEPQETFIAVPEGIMLNYLTRRENPAGFLNFMVPEIGSFGEEAMLSSMKKNPPDYFLFVDKNTEEFGVGNFGQDEKYGKKIMDWVLCNYFDVYLTGNEPLQGKGFGIKILKKRPI